MRIFLSLFVLMFFLCNASAQENTEIRLLVRGDDIGSFASANQACIDACNKGIVRSLEVMVPCAWFPEAAKLLNENPSIDVGVHLTLTSEWTHCKWRPLTFAPSLTDEYGYFYPFIWPKRDEPGRSIQEAEWKLSEIEAEFRVQIETAKKCIPHVTHITAHMGCAEWNGEVEAMTRRLAGEYGLYRQNPQTKPFPRMNATNRDSSEKRIAAFLESLEQLEPGNTYLFVEHPAYDTPEMQTVGHIGYENVASDRDAVTKIFTDQQVMDFIKQKGIRLIGYKDVMETRSSTQNDKVVITKNSSGAFELIVGGKPTFIKGAVGSNRIDLVKKYGGNGIRSGYTKERLDEAHALGLMVLVNLPVVSQRDGFDYDDTEAIRKQHEKVLNIVREVKDHPAVLMWALGNELDHVPQKVYEPNKIYYNMKMWDAVNDLAKAIHEIDPDHPVMTVVGSITEHKINALNQQCPDLDLLGVNEYGDLLRIPERLRQWKWTRPYMVTEWGPTGFWQMPRTPWGYHIEETSSQKADQYRERYEGTILADKEMCLGSFVFLWRQHQEYTHTWFGMFDREWRETEAVDVMRYEWTGKWPENRAPRVDSMQINGKPASDFIYLSPGERAVAQVLMRDPDKDDVVRYEWELLPELTEFGYGGRGERKSAPINCSMEIVADGTIRFTVPLQKGAYRLFVAGYDNGNHVAFANIPFHVGEFVKQP